jgi:hypothetical protein
MWISSAVSSVNTTGSFNAGMIIALVIAAIIFFVIARLIVKSGNVPNETRDEKFYLREIRKYVCIIALLMIGCAYFTIVWLIISAL